MCYVQFYLWYVSFSFGRIFYLLATSSSEAGLCLIVNPLAPSICNNCTWNLPKQLKAVKLGERFLTLRLLMSYIYGAPSKARNANVICIWTYFGNAETVSFYLLHNVSTLNQCREVSCVTCKHFAS